MGHYPRDHSTTGPGAQIVMGSVGVLYVKPGMGTRSHTATMSFLCFHVGSGARGGYMLVYFQNYVCTFAWGMSSLGWQLANYVSFVF